MLLALDTVNAYNKDMELAVKSLSQELKEYIYLHPGVTRDELADSLEANRGSVTTIVARLKRRGVIEERAGLLYPVIATSPYFNLIDEVEQPPSTLIVPSTDQRLRPVAGFILIAMAAAFIGYILGWYI